MSSEDAERWDARYERGAERRVTAAMPIALGHVDPAVLADFPVTGTALDVACGLGAQSLWLAQRGLHVEALDVSGIAIDALRDSVRAAGMQDRVTGDVCDFDGGLPDRDEPVDVIVCQRFRAPHLYESMLERLRPGGWLVMTVLSETGAEDPGEFHAPPNELTMYFDRPGCVLVSHHEADSEESIVLTRSV